MASGVPYQVQYSILPGGRDDARLWIEDTGRWFAGHDGRPLRAHGVLRVINARHEADQRLAYLSRFDALTGQMNRPHLTEMLDQVIDNAKRYRTSLGFLLAGIDNLGIINEAYGFEVADEVIVAVARRIRSRMRGGDGLGRYSGNKFGIIINKCDLADMPAAAQRFLEAVSEEVVPTQVGPIAARISIGGVLAPRHARNGVEAMNRAQEALGQCKVSRPGGFLAFAPSSAREEARRENARLTDEIVSALNEQRIVLAYEPIVDATSRADALCECLVRLRHADGTIMPAGSIVPISEKLGLVRLIDHRVLELAIAELVRNPGAHCSINLSAATAADQDWLTSLALRLHRQPGVAESPDRRDHRIGRDRRFQGDDPLRAHDEGIWHPRRHRRLRRRLHVLPGPARSRRRPRQDRRRLRPEHGALARRPLLRAHPDRPCPPSRARDRRGMGPGRGNGASIGAVGLQLPSGRACRPSQARSALGTAGRRGGRAGGRDGLTASATGRIRRASRG